MAGSLDDMTGRIYGMLTVIGRAGADSGRRATWACQCQCGRTMTTRGDSLRRGITKSCGECGAFHPQGLTAANAKYLINTYTADKASQGINAFGAAFERESGKLVFTPRKPTFIPSPLANALQQLATHGFIRAKENRTTIMRWATEERCVIAQTYAFDSEKALHAAWTELTGQLVDEVYVPPKDNRPVQEIAPLSADALAGFHYLLAEMKGGDDAASD